VENKTLKRKVKSLISEKNEFEILKLSARKSASVAVRESRLLGLTIKIISKNKLIEKSSTGEIKVLRKIEKTTSKNGLKKGTVLCRK
jgi:hypothetical protein